MGCGSEYREDARFVLKILPDLVRDTAGFDKRLDESLAAKQRKRWLSRRHFPRGTAGLRAGTGTA